VRCVVSDTGPLLHLTEADAFALTHLVGDLHIPPQVNAELAYLLSDWESPAWLKSSVTRPHARWHVGTLY
jgi:hypothetical protein